MKKTLKKVLVAVLAMAMLVSCLVGCGKEETKDDGAIISQLMADIVALDPARSYDISTMQVLGQVTENILAQQMDGSMKPHLAKSWEAVDELTYVYTMRDDVKSSNGDPMTMEDVLFSLNRHMDPEVASYLGWMVENVESIEQTGDWEFTVKLYEPDATFQYVFGTSVGAVIQKSACEAAGDDFGSTVEGLVGTGPYKLTSWTVGSELKAVYNENYWDPAYKDPDVKSITWTIIPEDTTRVSALTSGQTDLDTWVPGDMIDTLEKGGVKVQMKDSANFIFLAMNCQTEPFNDVNVRRAVAYAIPKQDICDNIIGEVGEMATSMPMGSYLYTFETESWEEYEANAFNYEYDMDKAKECLANSAYPDGFTVNLIIDEVNTNNAMALVIQESLAELGITVEIEKMTTDELINHEFGGVLDENGYHTFDMGLFEWEADWPDPSGNIMGIFHSAYMGEGGSNVPGYFNEEVDELLSKQAASTDEAERTQLLQDALDIIIDESPLVPISYTYYKMGLGEKIEYYDSVTWGPYFKDMKLAE